MVIEHVFETYATTMVHRVSKQEYRDLCHFDPNLIIEIILRKQINKIIIKLNCYRKCNQFF